jgi:hypothetical protein
MENIKASDLYGESSPKKAAKRHDEYMDTLNKSLSQAVKDPSSIMRIKSGTSTFANESGDAVSQLETLAANKSLAPEAINALNSALSAQRTISSDIVKEITTTVPLDSSFAAFDLEAPAKLLTPRPTPLRNKIVRKKGIGMSHRVKRILGYTGTGTGGQGNIWPGITQTTQNNFAPGAANPLYYERGPQISYTADDLVLPYNSYSLSDQVSFDANFSGLGYQDLRQLSSTSTLYATMLMEERMMLMARGTATGYSGALAAPTITTTVRDKTASETNISGIVGGHIYVYVTASAGAFGESVSATAIDTTVANNAKVVDVNITVPSTGAVGYNVYVGTGASDPGRAAAFYDGTTAVSGTAAFTITGPLATTGSVPPASQTSAYATGYDGILPTVLGANSGYNNNINALFSTSNPGVEYQTVFYNLYNNVKADPDEILINGSDRKQLSDAIKNGSTANYRLNLTQTEAGDYVGGATIGALYNEITGKMVNLTVHPWLPQGVSPVLSYTLPIPDTEVSDVWANVMVQDYMGIQWPVTQFTYDFSTYFRGTFFCYAPAWNGAVSGIKAA